MKQKGFTLVELIVVLAILAVLSAIMVPSLTGYIDKAKNTQLLSIARSVYTAAQIEVSEAYARGPFKVQNANNQQAQGNFPSIRNIVNNSEIKEWGYPGEDYVDQSGDKTINYLINGFGYKYGADKANYHFKILISTDGKVKELEVCSKDKVAILKDGEFTVNKMNCVDEHDKQNLYNFIFIDYKDNCVEKYNRVFHHIRRYP